MPMGDIWIGPKPYHPAISDEQGGAIGGQVSWYRIGTSVIATVVVQRVAGDGAHLWGPHGVQIRAASSISSEPALVADGHGGVFVFWAEPVGTEQGQILGQHVTADGRIVWKAPRLLSQVETMTLSDPFLFQYPLVSPVAVSDGSHGAIVAWSGSSGAGYDIHAARVTAGGGVPWALDVCTAPGDQIDLVMAPSGDGGAWLAWRDRRKADGWDVYAQHLGHDGRALCGRDGAPVCTATGSRRFLDVCSDDAGGAYLAWGDDRTGATVYAARLGGDGALAPGWSGDGVAIGRRQSGKSEATWMRLGPNGRGDAFLAWDEDPGTGPRLTLLRPDGPAARLEDASQLAAARTDAMPAHDLGHIAPGGIALDPPTPNPAHAGLSFS
jgi:hypothetical protein